MANVAVIGGNGQLGSDVIDVWEHAGYTTISLTHQEIMVEDQDSVRRVLTDVRPSIVVNTAAFHNVPKCEEDPLRSYSVNSIGALNIARVAQDLGAVNVYISTDYVFDGAKGRPYLEDDPPHPLNVYAATKLTGEYFTLAYCTRPYVVRVSGIYGRVPCRAKGGNFITTMMRAAKERPEVRVVTDEVLTPTPTREIANSLLTIVGSGAPGRYHATCEGACSWYEFARVIFDTLGFTTPLMPATVKDFPSPVKRPFYSVLENGAIRSQQLPALPHWKDALIQFLRQHHG